MSKLKSKPRILKAITKSLKHDRPRTHADWRSSGLSEKEFVWVENYLQHFNATRASEMVGCPGNARKHGWRTKQNPKVQAYIDSRLAEHALSADMILALISQHAHASFGDFLNGNTIDIEKGRENGVLHLIRRCKLGKNVKSIELVDSQAALKLLAKIHGLFKNGVRGAQPSYEIEDPDDLFKTVPKIHS